MMTRVLKILALPFGRPAFSGTSILTSRGGIQPKPRDSGSLSSQPPRVMAARDYAEPETFPEIIRYPEMIARWLEGQGWPA